MFQTWPDLMVHSSWSVTNFIAMYVLEGEERVHHSVSIYLHRTDC